MKTLIIRTDKVGDIYFTLPYINSIRKAYAKENLDLLIAENIYDHFAEKNYLYNNIYAFPKKGIIKKILLIIKLRSNNYKQILVFDGKDRSLIFTYLLKASKKIFFYNKKKINSLLKIFFLNKKKYIFVEDNKKETLNDLFAKMLSHLQFSNKIIDFKFIDFYNLSSINFPDNLRERFKKYTVFHLDERWFSKYYIKKFYDINLTTNDFITFINTFFEIHKHNLIITTGFIKLPFISLLKDNIFTYIQSNFYEYNYNNCKAILIENSTLNELEIIIMNSKNMITCHTGLSLLAGGFNVNLIDIIDKKDDSEFNYQRLTSHIKRYSKIYRKEFNELSKDILLKIEQ